MGQLVGLGWVLSSMGSSLRILARNQLSTLNQFASLQVRALRPSPLVLAGTHGVFDEVSSPVILTEESFGSESVHGSVLGLLEVWSELFSKDHWLGNEVLVSTARDGLVHVNSGPSSSTSQLEQESTVSLEASLKSKEFAPAPVHLFP